jgi:histone H3/H4
MTPWRNCSSCKKPILHRARYWVCSVSTCNRARQSYVFCSVPCWDAHVPVMNHRNAWAEERRAPKESVNASHEEAAPRRRVARRATPETTDSTDEDILIVASRLKAYINRKGGGMNTSADVLPALSDIVREAALDAIDEARADGRKTLKGRDFKRRR